MSNTFSTEAPSSSEQSILLESIWEKSLLPAFRINGGQKIVAGNPAINALITNPMAFYPGKSLMAWLGLANMEAFFSWAQAYLKGEQVENLVLEIQDLAIPLVLFEVIPAGQDWIVRCLPFQSQSAPKELLSEETITFFKELRSSISHDLRAPVRQLRLYTQKILAYSKAKIPAEIQEEMVFLNDSSGELLQRFEALSMLIENECRQVEASPVELSQIVSIVSGAFSLHLQDTNGEITVGNLPVVLTDQELLLGIVTEIMNNAVAHIPADRKPVISITSNESENATIVVFRDNGIGFANELAEKLFSSFSSIHPPEKCENNGTGMGLTIARRAAEKSGMTLTASGIENEGATFYLGIPNHLIPGKEA